MRSQAIQRTAHAPASLVQYMGINHRSADSQRGPVAPAPCEYRSLIQADEWQSCNVAYAVWPAWQAWQQLPPASSPAAAVFHLDGAAVERLADA